MTGELKEGDAVSQHTPEHDPHSRFEDEGIPDLQDGTPQQQWAVDPQEAPLPADHPAAVDDYGTTVDEMMRGEPLAGRLSREMPEEQPVYGTGGPPVVREERTRTGQAITEDGGLGFGSDLDTDHEEDGGVAAGWEARPEEPSGAGRGASRPAGRLVAPDEGAHGDDEPEETAMEVGPDTGGFSAEEAAMRVEPE
ncbi:DUF5709 domain-containing protein [Sphaerimonospora sp. CA-214678]|uniref:DUF5709 domain-containing protein n=1 Tax=Sphaerimonospora sp. CA-214678 TaxID=3240029 RepID=UPI003D8CD1FD